MMKHLKMVFVSVSEIFNTQYDVDVCECPLPCHVTKYNTKVTSAYFPFNNWWTIRYGDSMSDLEETRLLNKHAIDGLSNHYHFQY